MDRGYPDERRDSTGRLHGVGRSSNEHATLGQPGFKPEYSLGRTSAIDSTNCFFQWRKLLLYFIDYWQLVDSTTGKASREEYSQGDRIQSTSTLIYIPSPQQASSSVAEPDQVCQGQWSGSVSVLSLKLIELKEDFSFVIKMALLPMAKKYERTGKFRGLIIFSINLNNLHISPLSIDSLLHFASALKKS